MSTSRHIDTTRKNNEIKKILILGSDYFTLQVVNEAHKMGDQYYVIVADLMETSPTKEAADESWLISTTDTDALTEKCRENNVTAVMFGASDFNVEQARKLCRRLELPIYCDSDRAWEASRNKRIFKDLCKKVGAPVAEDYYLTDELSEVELQNIKYPVVVKPVDKSGNRGMSYCYNQQELISAYKYAREISDNKNIIVERKLTGTEHHVSYACGNGEVRLLSFAQANHDDGELANVYSFENTTPKFLKQFLTEVNAKLKKVFQKLGCRDGIVWADTMRDETDGKFYILEMGYRFAGAVASTALQEKLTGFNPVKWMLESSLGISHDIMPDELNTAHTDIVGLVHLFTHHAGKIGKISGLEEIEKIPDVIVDMPKRTGATVNDHQCIALISVYRRNCDEMIQTVKSIYDTLTILDEKGKDLVIYYRNFDKIKNDFETGIENFRVG